MRSHNSVTNLLLIMLAVTIVASAATLYRQGQQSQSISRQHTPRSKDREGVDFESQFPTTDFDAPEPTDPEQRAKRKAKNSHYDNLGLVSKQPSESISETVVENHWQDGLEGLPVNQSDAIVIGEATNARTFLSNDKKGVYTEFTLRVDEVLKSPDSALALGDTLCVDRPGGFVRYSDGHKILYRFFGLNMLRPNARYLLFLSDNDKGPNYRVLTGYSLVTGSVFPLDVAPQFDTYKGMDESSFLNAVHDAIAKPSPPVFH